MLVHSNITCCQTPCQGQVMLSLMHMHLKHNPFGMQEYRVCLSLWQGPLVWQ